MNLKLQILSTLVCAFGIGLGFACKLWFPQHWFDGFIVIIGSFYLVEMGIAFLLGKYEGKMSQATLEGKTFMKKYMIVKMAKLIFTLALVGVYLVMTKGDPNAHAVQFAVSAVTFYLFNLAVETFVVSNEIKKEKNQ